MVIKEIISKQKLLVKELNNMHIFFYQALSLLLDYKNNYQSDESNKLRKYYVPSIKKTKIAKRSEADLIKVYNHYINRALYENFIVISVSHFEAFLIDVLKIIILKYPNKLTANVQGLDSNRKISIDTVLNSKDINSATSKLIDDRLHSISFLPPKAYLLYFQTITGVETSHKSFEDYIEIKATRDLIIHNSGKINEIYLSKVGDLKRGELNQIIEINGEYYDHCIATLKEISKIVTAGIEANFK